MGLVDQDARVGQRQALARRAGGEQDGGPRRGLAHADRRHVGLDVLHRVVDAEAGGDRSAGRVDVELDVLVGVLRFEVQELADDLTRTRKELDKALAPDLDQELAKLREQVVDKDGVRSVVYIRKGLQTKDAQELLHRAQQALAPLVAIALGPAAEGCTVVASVAKELAKAHPAGGFLKAATAVLGGGGGGRPEMAQGKGQDAGKVDAAAAAVVKALQDAGLRA